VAPSNHLDTTTDDSRVMESLSKQEEDILPFEKELSSAQHALSNINACHFLKSEGKSSPNLSKEHPTLLLRPSSFQASTCSSF
jgi:hypothetical protein